MDEQALKKLDELLQKRIKENNEVLLKQVKEKLENNNVALLEDFAQVVRSFADKLNEKKADKSQTVPLEVRVDNLERKVFPQ